MKRPRRIEYDPYDFVPTWLIILIAVIVATVLTIVTH